MKVVVMSRVKAAEYASAQHKESSVVISITDPGSEPNSIVENNCNGIKAVLRVSFNDTDTPGSGVVTEEDADKIACFVKNNQSVDMVIVHCEAGMSRSAGCAAAILKYFTNDDTQIFDNAYYRPNRAVYRRVLNALYAEQ